MITNFEALAVNQGGVSFSMGLPSPKFQLDLEPLVSRQTSQCDIEFKVMSNLRMYQLPAVDATAYIVEQLKGRTAFGDGHRRHQTILRKWVLK